MKGPDPLIERGRRGDPAAFRELFLLHRGMVTRVVSRFLGPSPDVEDVVQEVFVQVHRALPSFRGDAKLSTWLYRLAVNVTKMHLRHRRIRPPRATDEAWEDAAAPVDTAEPPDEAMARQRRVRALYRLLDTLPEKKRTVLVLHDLEGLDARRIAEVVDAPVVTVRTRLFYARRALYAALSHDPELREVIDGPWADLPGHPRASAPPTGSDASTKGRRP
jgi:RNA polymerase sigma-70 factor, ECF subfamily